MADQLNELRPSTAATDTMATKTTAVGGGHATGAGMTGGVSGESGDPFSAARTASTTTEAVELQHDLLAQWFDANCLHDEPVNASSDGGATGGSGGGGNDESAVFQYLDLPTLKAIPCVAALLASSLSSFSSSSSS